jgi:hypothetical protein
MYNLTGSFVASHIDGDTVAIQRAQRSSARYYQRPDARTGRYRPNATSMDGWSGFLNLGKEAGDYQGGLFVSATSPGFETNDAGFQTSADDIAYYGFVNRRWTKPGKVFRFAFIGNNLQYRQNFDRVTNGLHYNLNTQGTFLNYWNADAHFDYGWRTASDNLTRGGPLADTPANWNVSGGIGTDSRRRFSTYNGGSFARDEIGGWSANWFATFDVRPTTATTLSVQPSYNASAGRLYLSSQTDALATTTFGNQYVFAEVDQHSLDLTTRLNVTFRPTLSLQFWVQPFAATGDYRDFKELARPRSLDYTTYGRAAGSTLACFDAKAVALDCYGETRISYYQGDPDGGGARASVRIDNPDFDSRSVNGNAVLRWEYRPGSTMFFVWSTDCAAGGGNPRWSASQVVRRLCAGPSNNVFALKANYWVSF